MRAIEKALLFADVMLASNNPRFCRHVDRGLHKYTLIKNSKNWARVLQKLVDGDTTECHFTPFTYKPDSQACEAGNVVGCTALWIDIDPPKEGKDYERRVAYNNDQAVELAREVCTAVGMASFVVNSGGGLHLYWALDKEYPIDEWRTQQEKLIKYVRDTLNIEIDVQASLRSSGTMRTPYSRNYKRQKRSQIIGGTYKPYSLAAMQATLAKYVSDTEVRAAVPDAFKNPPPFLRAVSVETGKLEEWLPPRWDVLADDGGCGFVKWYDQNSDTAGNDDWFPAMQIAYACGGMDLCIEKSSAHPDFNEEGVRSRIGGGLNPPLCRTIELRTSFGGCETCPHKGKIKTPVAIDARRAPDSADNYKPADDVVVSTEAANQTIREESKEHAVVSEDGAPLQNANIVQYTAGEIRKHLPDSYDVMPASGDSFGGITVTNAEGKKFLVLDMIIYAVTTVNSPSGKQYVFRAHLPNEPVKDITIRGSIMTKPQELLAALADHGVMLTTCNTPQGKAAAVKYLIESARQCQNKEAPIASRHNFGWNSTRKNFLHGSWTIHGKAPEDCRVTKLSDACHTYLDALTPKDTARVAEWARGAEIYSHEGMEEAQFVLAASLGTPLLGLMPQAQGALINLFSTRSGVGKSTLGYAAMSIWGRPNASGENVGLAGISNDTVKSTLHKLALFKNLPIYTDETTTQSTRDVYSFVYQLTQGREQDRMNRSGTDIVDNRGSWQTIAITSSNASVIDKLNREAGANHEAVHARVIEIDMAQITSARSVKGEDGLLYTPREIEDRIRVMTAENYAVVGQHFIRCIAGQEDKVAAMWIQVENKLQDLFNFTQPERFWRNVAVAAITALRLGNTFGYWKFDEDAVLQCLRKILSRSRNNLRISAFNIVECAQEYLAFHMLGGVVQDTMGGKAVTTGTNREVTWRHHKYKNEVCISVRHFRKWLAEFHNISPTEFNMAVAAEGLKEKRIYLYEHVPLAVNQTRPNTLVFDDQILAT